MTKKFALRLLLTVACEFVEDGKSFAAFVRYVRGLHDPFLWSVFWKNELIFMLIFPELDSLETVYGWLGSAA